MAKKDSKRPPKASSSTTTTFPEPFVSAPASLEPFLSTLAKTRLYIAHIDRHPAFFKRRIFTVPLLLNFGIFLLLCWRLYAILPFYGSIFLTIFGYDSPTSVNINDYSKTQLAWMIFKRSGTFLFDFLLFRFIGPWPYSFFLESPNNPVRWRLNVGFQDTEVYVRVSRSFNTKDFLGATNQGIDNPFFKVRVIPAVDPAYLQGKTGYLTMGADWDLDFGRMTKTQRLAEDGVVSWDDLETSVFVYGGEGKGWGVWKVEESKGLKPDDEGLAQAKPVVEGSEEDKFLKQLAREAEKEEERYREE